MENQKTTEELQSDICKALRAIDMPTATFCDILDKITEWGNQRYADGSDMATLIWKPKN